MENGTVTTFPSWKTEIDELLEKYKTGDIVPKEELYSLFDCNPEEAGISVPVYQKRNLRFMEELNRLRTILLVEHKQDFQNVRGRGYLLVPPSEQALRAEADLHKVLLKEMRRCSGRVQNTDITQLNHEERRRHTDAAARIATIEMMMRNERKNLPTLYIEDRTEEEDV
jgi:hypothetical protein